MRITRIDAKILRVPVSRSLALPVAGTSAGRQPSITVLLAQLETDDGATGLGFGCYPGGGRALQAAIEDDLSPLLLGEDPLNHERLWAKVRTLDQAAAAAAYAPIDIALWDLKGKAAGLPLWKMLGGARESAKAFTAETAGACLSAEAVIALARSAMAQGVKGIRVAVAGVDPETESQKIVTIRDTLGEDIWFAVTVEGRFDYETALPFGRFIEEEIGADWFEDPLADGDLNSYSRLSARIDTPLATGSRYTDASQFVRLLESGTRAILRPDVIGLGGLTPWLKVAAMAELQHRPVVPYLLPEVGVHLACGLPGVQAVEYVPWLSPLFTEPARLVNGELVPAPRPGLGLDLNADRIAKFEER